MFRTPNRLKEKLQGGNFEFSSDGGLADDYSDWVKETITDLVGAHEEAQNSFGKAEEQMKGAREKINILAHELRGQGGIFGYPLISEFGKSLYNCTGNSARVTENLFEFVKAHIDGITAVINGNVKGDADPWVRNCCRVWKRRRKRTQADPQRPPKSPGYPHPIPSDFARNRVRRTRGGLRCVRRHRSRGPASRIDPRVRRARRLSLCRLAS